MLKIEIMMFEVLGDVSSQNNDYSIVQYSQGR